MAEFLTPVKQNVKRKQRIRRERNKIRCKDLLRESPNIVTSAAELKRLAEVDLTVNVSP